MQSIVWFRQDLRLADNPALAHAASKGAVLPISILDESAGARASAARRAGGCITASQRLRSRSAGW
jgi:deoxyribodipyrimidine photo-lyase